MGFCLVTERRIRGAQSQRFLMACGSAIRAHLRQRPVVRQSETSNAIAGFHHLYSSSTAITVSITVSAVSFARCFRRYTAVSTDGPTGVHRRRRRCQRPRGLKDCFGKMCNSVVLVWVRSQPQTQGRGALCRRRRNGGSPGSRQKRQRQPMLYWNIYSNEMIFYRPGTRTCRPFLGFRFDLNRR